MIESLDSPEEYNEFLFWRQPVTGGAVPDEADQMQRADSSGENEDEDEDEDWDAAAALSTAAGGRLLQLLSQLTRHLGGTSVRTAGVVGVCIASSIPLPPPADTQRLRLPVSPAQLHSLPVALPQEAPYH